VPKPPSAASEGNSVIEVVLKPSDTGRLAALCGPFDENLRLVEETFGVALANRGAHFRVTGAPPAAEQAAAVLQSLYAAAESAPLEREAVEVLLAEARGELASGHGAGGVRTRRRSIRPRGPRQSSYVAAIRNHDLAFGIGPAGTGKTYLAVACAVEALEEESVRRLVLVRPAVEAGERLGFLPGDLAQKVDPYLRPIYDALYETMGFERVGRLIERGVIEIAPLAYMRGRTLNEAFIILDEAQNATVEQMRMFLTRIGFGSQAVVTGDVTQTDLPPHIRPGLKHAAAVLKDVPGISFTFFTAKDVIRHPLVAEIVSAYERHDPGAG
jgi:phosphate starvation-inducible protein PhoH and related proteins